MALGGVGKRWETLGCGNLTGVGIRWESSGNIVVSGIPSWWRFDEQICGLMGIDVFRGVSQGFTGKRHNVCA